ncbi:hypothetical protein CBS101457_003551 [Exobasidium rhododendri]|nr:hypothetical protein CBS101457_003551 [Exobasidium rhododendri]
MSIRGYAGKPEENEFSEQHSSGNLSGFGKREQAQENQYIQQQNADKLKKLREKLAAQRQHLDDVDAAINDLEKKD